MSYNNAIPQPTDQLSQSQPQILANFAEIQTLVSQDHVNFNVSGEGKHKQTTFPVQSPAPTFAAGENGLYNFLNPTSTLNELYITRQDGHTNPITAAVSSGAQGWSFLPSGILMKWGTISFAGGGTPPVSGTDTFIVGPGAFTTIYTAQATPVKLSTVTSNTVVITNVTNTTISGVNWSTNAITVYYLIMGRIAGV